MDDTTAQMDAVGAKEVHEWTQKFLEEDLCEFAALVMRGWQLLLLEDKWTIFGGATLGKCVDHRAH